MSNPDLLIVLGKNIGIESSPEDIRQDPDHLSIESRMSADGAYELLDIRDGEMDILFSGGRTAGEAIPSEASAMKAYFMREHPDVPEGLVLPPEEKSIDTRTNAIEVASMLSSTPDHERVDLMSVFYHVANAAVLFRRFGVPINHTHASDDLVGERSTEDKAFVHDWYGSERIRKEVQKERVRSVLLSTIDRRGKLLHAVTARRRG